MGRGRLIQNLQEFQIKSEKNMGERRIIWGAYHDSARYRMRVLIDNVLSGRKNRSFRLKVKEKERDTSDYEHVPFYMSTSVLCNKGTNYYWGYATEDAFSLHISGTHSFRLKANKK